MADEGKSSAGSGILRAFFATSAAVTLILFLVSGTTVFTGLAHIFKIGSTPFWLAMMAFVILFVVKAL